VSRYAALEDGGFGMEQQCFLAAECLADVEGCLADVEGCQVSTLLCQQL
jgi:hypothetical protein